MTREEIIAILEQHIESLEREQADPQVDPREKDQQSIQDALEESKIYWDESRQETKQPLKKSMIS